MNYLASSSSCHVFTAVSAAVLLLGWETLPAAGAGDPAELAARARSVLRTYCFECHGQDGSKEGGMDYVADLATLVTRKKVVPGDPVQSRIAFKMRQEDEFERMPPEGAANGNPSEDDIAAVEEWIAAGAPAAAVAARDDQAPREFVSRADVITAIRGHLDRLDPEDRRFQRYFTLEHLHNQPPSVVPPSHLQDVRAAVAKVLNSLSWRFDIVVPNSLDKEQTVLAFDLRDIDWDENRAAGRADLWLQLVAGYPYALSYEESPDNEQVNEQWAEITARTGIETPAVRADWFVANASQPPLYYTLLFDKVLPGLADRPLVDIEGPDGTTHRAPAMNVGDLERFLRVDAAGNIRRGRAARAGFTGSGVSKQPRIVERHPGAFGHYWKSYDFGPNNPTSSVQARPLGPAGTHVDRQLQPFEFTHDGGEMIFNLPNGLQGYLLADGAGQRIAVGPIKVVSDSKQIIGTPEIVCGVSCMACHKLGVVRDFRDEVRLGAQGLNSKARRQVRRLFLDAGDIEPLLDKDEQRFLAAEEQAIGPFLRTGPDDKRPTSELGEPVGPVTRRFLRAELSLAELAAELGLRDTGQLAAAIEHSGRLNDLRALLNGARIKRERWEAGDGFSQFQRAALVLKTGTPTDVVIPGG